MLYQLAFIDVTLKFGKQSNESTVNRRLTRFNTKSENYVLDCELVLAVDKVKGKNVPILYKPYYFLEKRILEPMDAWISKQAFFTIAAQLAILAAIIAFIGTEQTRRNNEIFNAWQTITSAEGQSGSGGRIEALEFLHSRPLKFPWIGWAKKGWYWDEGEEECKFKRLWGLRWERQTLEGLSAPNEAYLAGIDLCGADLWMANLPHANLAGANLQDANLSMANLQDTRLGGSNLQGADLVMANLQDAYLERANLQNGILVDANLQNANLMRANLQDAYLERANLQNGILVWANLQDAYLGGANLQNASLVANLKNAYLVKANLQNANLWGANFKNANLGYANLENAYLEMEHNLTLTFRQIKSACLWDKAIYRGKWDEEKEALIAIEPNNTNFIEELKNDTASEPKEPPDCSRWENSNEAD